MDELYERLEVTGIARRLEKAGNEYVGVPLLIEAPADDQTSLFGDDSPPREPAIWQWLEERGALLVGARKKITNKDGVAVDYIDVETVTLYRQLIGPPAERRLCSFRLELGDDVTTVHHCGADQFGCLQLLRTGPEEFTRELVMHGYRQGLQFRACHLYRLNPRTGNRRLQTFDEEQVFTHLGLEFIPPAERTAARLSRAIKRGVR